RAAAGGGRGRVRSSGRGEARGRVIRAVPGRFIPFASTRPVWREGVPRGRTSVLTRAANRDEVRPQAGLFRPSPGASFHSPPRVTCGRRGFRGGGQASSPAPLIETRCGLRPDYSGRPRALHSIRLHASLVAGGGSAGEDKRPHPRLRPSVVLSAHGSGGRDLALSSEVDGGRAPGIVHGHPTRSRR